MLAFLLALALGYLAGSIPSGVIVTRAAGAQDPRGIGSKNIGATNVLRTGRKDLAAITLIADALKGTIAVLIAVHFDDGSTPIRLGVLAAFGAFLGHLFPLFLGFRGGKGVATFLGCLIGLAWPAAIAFAIIWLGVAFASRYSSAAALVASAATPFVLAALGRQEGAVVFAILAAILWIKHRANIERLRAGTEGRIGKKKRVRAVTEAPRDGFDAARRFAWLRLWRSENIGPRTFQTLLGRYGSAEAALEALPDLLRKTRPGRPIKIAGVEEIEREFAAAERLGARFLCRDEAGYPALLREIDGPPAVIAVRGRVDLLDRPAIAIVGARNASAAGLAFAERMGRGLAQEGYVIVSGFARGIDSRAHRASLASGTIAVLAGGHDRLYPADQGSFMDKILEDGAAISEMPFGWEARGRDFPRRNRLVSGLSLGVVVVEAARRSGSLITARFAADQGREVFAVPGSPLDPRAEGTNDLIRDGATFCTEVEDVIRALADRKPASARDDLFSDSGKADEPSFWDELDFTDRPDETEAPARSPELYAFREPDMSSTREPADAARPPLDRVVERLGPAPVSIDELARAAEMPIREVRTAVLELEMAGRIERHGGGLVSLLMAEP